MRVRNEVEKIIKEQNLDRSRVFEVSKIMYESIIKKIEKTFVNKNGQIHWSNMGNFNSNFSCQYRNIHNHCDWYYSITQIIPPSEKTVYVLLEDVKAYTPKYWLYEMCLPELIKIIDNLWCTDFYIVSKKYEWLISENHEEVATFLGDTLNLSVLDNIV